MKAEKPYSATQYHQDTSYDRGGLGGHMLDWAHPPKLDKSYPRVDVIPLTRKPDLPDIFFTDPMKTQKPKTPVYKKIDAALLSTLFALSYTFTAKTMHGSQPFYYRSAASAGALYPCELYFSQQMLTDIETGVYHYNIFDFSLEKIRHENMANSPVSDEEPSAAAFFFITGIFFRSSWKYAKRAYRYLLLDTGHLLSNLIHALKSQGLEFSIHMDFHDDAINTLLGLDTKKEVCLAMVAVKGDDDEGAGKKGQKPLSRLSPDIIGAGKVSEKEAFYKEMEAIHQAGAIVGKLPVTDDFPYTITRIAPGTWQPVTKGRPLLGANYVEVLFRRRSKRNFVSTPMDQDCFMQMLDPVCTAFYDHAPQQMSSGLKLGMLINNIQGAAPGFYLVDPSKKRFGTVFEGNLAEKMASACLDQMWLKNAAIHFLFMADMKMIDEKCGPRGYRHAMMLAGILGQMIYLAATATGCGACGIGAIYDKEAADLLNLKAPCSLLYLVAAGPVKKV